MGTGVGCCSIGFFYTFIFHFMKKVLFVVACCKLLAIFSPVCTKVGSSKVPEYLFLLRVIAQIVPILCWECHGEVGNEQSVRHIQAYRFITED